MLTHEELKRILSYNKKTGIFKWKIRPTNSVQKGDVAGTTSKWKRSAGYIAIGFKNKTYWAHRLAWFYVYGELPKSCIDHINHNKSDNRICNLRETTNKDNHRNVGLYKHNNSGVNGVSWIERLKKWTARINIDGKNLYLGLFSKKKDAIKARSEANEKYGFHKNHGKKR